MDLQSTTKFVAAGAASARRQLGKVALAFVVVLALGFLAPLVPILVGTLAVIAAAMFAWVPETRPVLQPMVRVPVADRGTRHAWLVTYAIAGAFLVVVGSFGATTRGQVVSEWEADRRRTETAEADARLMLERAHEELERGSVGHAELTLMDARTRIDAPAHLMAEIEALYQRVHRSGDVDQVVEVMVGLSAEEFEALASSQAVPAALEFPERVLTLRALGIARDQLERVRALREQARAPETADAQPQAAPQG